METIPPAGTPGKDSILRKAIRKAGILPPILSFAEARLVTQEPPEELIGGVLRLGHKMLLTGCPKAGKSFLLMELAAAIARGGSWLGFPCRKGKVLYVNLEIDPGSCVNRFRMIFDSMGLREEETGSVLLWNLRGYACTPDIMVSELVDMIRGLGLSAVIIDPLYKILPGDENSAGDIAALCSQLDRICRETGCAVIYCHHHSKGFQGEKRSMDRASGSGVFARDADALLDMIGLELSDEAMKRTPDATAWRLEGTLREFAGFPPVHFWFEYPTHRVDEDGILEDMPAQGSFAAGRMNKKRSKAEKKADEDFLRAYETLDKSGNGVTVKEMAAATGLAERTIRNRIRMMKGTFTLDRGIIRPTPCARTAETGIINLRNDMDREETV